MSPRAQHARSQARAPTSVREVLYRDVYRGTIAWRRLSWFRVVNDVDEELDHVHK
jgi:hypothetical protein